MKKYIFPLYLMSLFLVGCNQESGIISTEKNIIPDKIQEVLYGTEELSSPIFLFTGVVFSGTQNIKVTRENSGAKKEYVLPYKRGEKIFKEVFRLDKQNIGYGDNMYTIDFLDITGKVIAEGKLELKSYYQNINIGIYTIYFNEKGVRNCGGNCWVYNFLETSKAIELKDKDVAGTGENYEVINFLNEDIMPYGAILYKSGSDFRTSTGYLLYNKKSKQLFQAENIRSMSGEDRIQLGNLYLNGNLIIKEFPVKYLNTGGGSIIPIIYEPKKDLISTKREDGDGCGYIKGVAQYKLSSGKRILYSNILEPQTMTLEVNNNKLEVESMYSEDNKRISLIAKYSKINNKEWKIQETETLIDNVEIKVYDEYNPCEQMFSFQIDEKTQKAIVKRHKTVGGKTQTFIRSFNNGEIKEIQ